MEEKENKKLNRQIWLKIIMAVIFVELGWWLLNHFLF